MRGYTSSLTPEGLTGKYEVKNDLGELSKSLLRMSSFMSSKRKFITEEN